MRNAFDFLMSLVLWGTLTMTAAGTLLGVLVQLLTSGDRARLPRARVSRGQPSARCSMPLHARPCQIGVADHACAPA